MMAEDRSTPAERERISGPNADDPLRVDPTPATGGLGVYDRPAKTGLGANSTLTTIIGIVLLLIVAYFLYQWLF